QDVVLHLRSYSVRHFRQLSQFLRGNAVQRDGNRNFFPAQQFDPLHRQIKIPVNPADQVVRLFQSVNRNADLGDRRSVNLFVHLLDQQPVGLQDDFVERPHVRTPHDLEQVGAQQWLPPGKTQQENSPPPPLVQQPHRANR